LIKIQSFIILKFY